MASGRVEKGVNRWTTSRSFFCLPNQDGAISSAASILRRSPLPLIFYSGSWCPACNLGLRALEEVHPLIEARGGSLIASSSQTVEENKSSVSRCDTAGGTPRHGIMRRGARQ
ncbi:redoxin domain-containing protein [Bradyrhizobium sp. AZCC 1577]|uniref:redoxin domain-containing protein n=1 Tax=Bradyrhizobium sp. AZCC 1577 TaxID=3117019 RepID=UPI003FA528A2